jgi:hypothetical protein
VKLKMAGMKSWLEKIKNRILKKDLDDDLMKSKIQSEENIPQEAVEKKELPDLITPTHENINASQKQIRREEAMRVNLNENEIEFNNLNIKNRPEKDVPDGRKRSNPNR